MSFPLSFFEYMRHAHGTTFRKSFECNISCQGQWYPETVWRLYVELLLISTGQNYDISLINGNKGYFEKKGYMALELSLTTKNVNEKYFISL